MDSGMFQCGADRFDQTHVSFQKLDVFENEIYEQLQFTLQLIYEMTRYNLKVIDRTVLQQYFQKLKSSVFLVVVSCSCDYQILFKGVNLVALCVKDNGFDHKTAFKQTTFFHGDSNPKSQCKTLLVPSFEFSAMLIWFAFLTPQQHLPMAPVAGSQAGVDLLQEAPPQINFSRFQFPL